MRELYDDRAAIETEINADTSGLLLPRRRQKHRNAQEAFVLLTDLAHTMLAWTRRFWAPEAAMDNAGSYFLIHEIMTIPGKLFFNERQLVNVRLKATHPLAKPVLSCLSRM